MNKIYKVIYSKVRNCYVVVSELAKNQRKCHSVNVKGKTALAAAILLALTSFCLPGMPSVAQAADGTESLRNNDFVGANDQYWYYDEDAKEWKTYQYKLTSAFNNRARGDLPNYQGGGAKFPGAVTAGLYAQAGQQTVTIGDRNAGQSKGSVFIGEHSGYNNGNNDPAGMKNNYVTSVGFQSDATGWGSIAIGSNAKAENSKMESQVVKEVGKANTSGTVSDDTYGIEENPTIQGASVALGYNAHSKDGNIAIGSYSDATSTNKNDSYVSVGNANLKRRITNVAEGTNASDVATVGQLMALEAKSGTYKAGFGIEITPDTAKKENTISLDRNLGTNYTDKAHHGDEKVNVAVDDTGLVLGGYAEDEKGNKKNPAVTYGATGEDSVTVGGKNSLASGKGSVVTGGVENIASGATAVAIGGNNNDAIGTRSAVLGGLDNTAFGDNSMVSGGSYNVAGGIQSAVLGGFSNYALGTGTTSIGGYGKDYETGYDSSVNGDYSVGVAGGSTGKDAKHALAAGNQAVVTTENGTAIGYQATTDEAKTIAFGHDAGDVSGYTIEWNKLPENQVNADGTTNDYTKAPKSVTPTTYKDAYYNRLVKVADGVDDHDVVVMEQLTKATNDLTKNLSVNAGWGINVNDVTTKNDDGTETTTKNVISLNRNLGTNYGHKYGNGKVTFEADGENSLILGGGAINDSLYESNQDFTFGAHAKDSVLVGGMNNDIDKNSERALIVGGTNNKTLSTNKVQQTGTDAIIVGGDDNKAEGDGSVLIGGNRNEASGLYSMTVGGTVNKNEGWLSSIFGGTKNNILKSDKSDPTGAAIFGGTGNTIEGEGIAATIFGGENNVADNLLAVVVGGEANHSSGNASTVLGGNYNLANGTVSTAIGGQVNNAIGNGSVVVGGGRNLTSGTYSYASGGLYNNVTGTGASSLGGGYSSVNGMLSTGVAGGSTGQDAFFSLAAGYQSVVADGGAEKTYLTGADASKVLEDLYSGKKLPGYYMQDPSVETGPENPGRLIHYDKFSTALGYQATANKPGTIAFGHDAGDESGYTYEWETLTDEKGNPKQNEIDGTTNDYTKAPKSIKKNEPYTSAYYNRLVKVADGIDDHDVVVMEQLKQYAEKDASNLGNNIKVYKTDEKGNVQLGKDKQPVEDKDATTTAQKNSKDAWGTALGADTFSEGTPEKATDASTSDQLVTGKTLYNYDAPVAETGKKLNYVSANNTTGQNLLNLDRQVKTNTDKLSDVDSRSVKYDTKKVNGKTVVDNTKITLAGEGGTTITNLKDGVNANDAATVGQMNTAIGNAKTKYYSVHEGPQIAGFSTNEKNNGASALAGLAAGYETGTAGIGSTVVGSYSGVMNTGKTSSIDLRGAASISLGTLNLNQNTDINKTFSGVANSIVGQGNMTTNSNAAIIIGAGNTITNSYKDVKIDTSTMKGSTPEALEEALQKAVPESGGQVMAIGGGNKISEAYKTQVVGLGNMVSGTELNYVEGFNNTVTGGTSNYIIGAQNTLTGGSKNIVFGDNHTLNNKKNNVVLGSADSSKELAASDAVVIGHNADVNVDNGVALGSDSVASVKEGQKGYDPAETVTNKTTAPWTSTKAAVSVGKADGSITRQITGVAAGTNDTDAVNVAQIKKLASVDASNIGKNFKDGDVTTNENAWGEALGTGTVTKDSKQLVTGSTVYNEVRPSKDGAYVKMSQTTGDNLLKLDNQVKTNTDKLSDVDSRSVKYDTKTVNDKTVVDNTKITLAGEGGTTITNLKDGVNANDAATMGQLNARISGVTYKAGDGIKYDTDAHNNKTISVNKGDGLKFTEDHKLAVNTGKHLSVNTDGQIDVGDNGAVAENDGNLVTGDTVYKALNGGMTKMIIGTPGKNGKDGTPGTIGLVGPAGTNGKDGVVDITIQKGEDGKDGTKGANGVDGKDGINRIVYEDKNGKHQVATMEDGLKFAGDDGQNDATKAIAKKLNNTVDIIGGADSTKLTANNIGVNNVDGKLKIQLAQELTGITSISGSTGSNGAKITLDTKDQNISVNGGKITNVASGLSTNDGSYNAKDANNAANISDVNSMISKAVTDAKGETQQDLDKKANVDASNIGTNLKGANGKTAATKDEQKANLDQWGKAIGTGEVKDGSKQLVTGNTVYNAVKDKADKSYVDTQLNTKANTDGSNIDADKFSKKVAIGKINDSDERAVSGKTVHEAINTINGNIDGKANKNLDNIDDAGKNVIKDQARAAVTIDNKGLNTNVVATQDDKNHTTTYTINVEGNGKVAAKDTGLISGDTIYNELRPSGGTYINQNNTTAQNITNLDTQVKKNSDLVNSDGSTIKIGSKDSATKVDISDKNGSGRVITGVVTDTNDASSAANVGYVNNMAAANTQQIYRDMNNAYGRLDNNINRAAAGSNALAALHPLEFDPDDKLSFAMGYGHYHNANAAAVGAFYQPNSKTQFNFGVALGNGDPGFNAGIAFKLGKSSPYAGMNRVTLIHTVQDLKASDEAKDKRIDALEKENQEMKKQLQAIMAKLNG